jgi:MICOS complex subunit MIC26
MLQLPIYDAPTRELILVDTPSELEKQIGVARRAVMHYYSQGHSQVQGVVNKWIGVEHAVERMSFYAHNMTYV